MARNAFLAARREGRAVVSMVLCCSLILNGCGGGGDEDSSGSSGSNALVTYSRENGNVTHLTMKDPPNSRIATFDFTQSAAGNTVFAAGSIVSTAANSPENYTYNFDTDGILRNIVDQTTGSIATFNYFTDHMEMRVADGSGVPQPAIVVYAVGDILIAGFADPQSPYTLATLTNKTDVTAAVRQMLIEQTGSPAPLAQVDSNWLPFDLISAAYAQAAPIDFTLDNSIEFPSIPDVVLKHLPQILIFGGAIAVLVVCGASGGSACAISAAIFILVAPILAKASPAEEVPAGGMCLNGNYEGVDGVGRPGTGTMSGHFIQGRAAFPGTDESSWTWRGQVTLSPPDQDVFGTLTGVLTRRDFGVQVDLPLRGSVGRDGTLARMNILGTHPVFGEFGTPLTKPVVATAGCRP